MLDTTLSTTLKSNLKSEKNAIFQLQGESAMSELIPLMEKIDEPIMLIDLSVVERLAEQWFEELPTVAPFYAMKSNDDAEIIATLGKLGVGFDCASLTELDMALNIGHADPEKIIFANPCKSKSSIAYAKAAGVKKMTFDCPSEVDKIAQIFPEAEVVLRVHVDDSGAICRLGTKFGAKPEESVGLIEKCIDLGLKIIGCSFHVGSGQQDPKSFQRALELMKTIYDAVEKKFDLKMKFLDIGGGFPGFDGDNVKNRFSAIASKISRNLRNLFPEHQVIAEPGRYFCTSSCTLITKVISKKETFENGVKKFAYYINEGVYGSFNNIIYDHAEPKPIFDDFTEYCEEVTCDSLFPSTIYGPTCDSIDVILKDFPMPEQDIDSLFVWNNMGAYTTCGSSTFNGFAHAKRIHIKKERTEQQ